MFIQRAGPISAAALALTLAACSGGGSEGTTFYVSTCSLGCTSGETGSQIQCGVVGIAENQEVVLQFTSPIDPFSITKESFAVREAISGASAAGTRFVDPLDPRRLVFRPKLTVGPSGEPIFGFESGKAYEVYLNGTLQNDPTPYVTNTTGRPNEVRVACTVQASQGVVDTIPGKPSVELFVTEVDALSGATTQVQVLQGVVPGAVNVKTFSSVRFEFDELMDISSLFDPSTGVSPNIVVSLDADGSMTTAGDREAIDGSYIFSLDQSAQTTALTFTPTTGFPSLGQDENQPRLVVVTLGAGVQDIAGNGLDSPGSYNFVPQQITFPAVTLPPGGEQFDDQANLDAPVSGSPWGTATAGRLTPGEGGGSGRHGELHVAAGETVVLNSSAIRASAEVIFTANPGNNDEITFGDTTFIFKTNPLANPLHVPIRYSLSYTVSTLVDTVRAWVAANPSAQAAGASYTQTGQETLRVEALSPGIPTPNFPLLIELNANNPPFADLSSSFLTGGFETHTYTDPDIVTNFDFSPGTGTPGGTPPDLSVGDGIFEFSRVVIEPTAKLVLAGENPVRLLVRGDFLLSDLASIELSGEDRPAHFSTTPYGQPGGRPGPNGGFGGRGGDRSDQPDMANSQNKAITIANPITNGTSAMGVGNVAGLGQGVGGRRYPNTFPSGPSIYNEWAHNSFCTSGMMANTGSGGAYAKDGVRGQTKVFDATGTSLTGDVPNKPPTGDTLGGVAANIGLEPPSADPTAERLLSPALGFLRGGSGGGGAGAHVANTQTDILTSDCFNSPFFFFSDHSGAAGGGGGGALQVQAGGTLTLTGQIFAGGGDGGSFAASTNPDALYAAPGGGGSGGAVLLQGGVLALAQQPSRIVIAGGTGGQGGFILTPSIGGAGSPGIVRVEQAGLGNGPDEVDIAPIVFPTDPLDPTSIQWLSSGDWLHDVAKTDAFESVTGSQSCWMEVPGTHFSVTFEDDPAAPALPADMGWNMDVILDLGAGEITVPWRGSDGNGPFLGLYPEEQWGTLLNRDLGVGESGAPIVVRFQGARVDGIVQDPCNLVVNDPDGPLVVGSVTPWVRQPRELNDFFPLVNAARFLVLFDRSHPDFDLIKGVTNLRIEAQPE